MKKREAEFTTKAQHWIRKNLPAPCVVEIKHTRGKPSFPLREIAPHQKASLLAAESPTGFTYKIPDCGFHNPFDVILFGHMYAYVMIRYPSSVSVIEASTFFEYTKKMKSISEDEAAAIAAYTLPW